MGRISRVVLVVAACVSLTATSCGEKNKNKNNTSTGTTRSYVTVAPYVPRTPTTLFADAALRAAVDNVLRSTPEKIAADLSRYGGSPILALTVSNAATGLCRSNFNAQVSLDMLERWAKQRTIALTPATNRIALLAQRQCWSVATPARMDTYTKTVSRSLLLGGRVTSLPVFGPAPPSGLATKVCTVLALPHATDVVGFVLDGLLEIATKGKVEGGVFLSLGLEIAARSCPSWLPRAGDVLARFAS